MQNFTGIYWGAFDPLTSAHKAIIRQSLQLSCIQDLVIVVNNNGYKNYFLPLAKRINLLENAVEELASPNIRIFSQDDNNPLNFEVLSTMTPNPLCAIAGYDAYLNWMDYSTKEERCAYQAIAVVPRGSDNPILYDGHAFLMPIDTSYRYVSSTAQKSSCPLF